VFISDTTLRDGVQMPGLRLTPEQKVTIAEALSRAGIHSIDCGFPAAGESEADGLRAISKSLGSRGPMLSALSRTKDSDIELAAECMTGISPFKRAITLFIGTSPIHREHKHNMTKKQVLETAVRAVEKATKHFELISFGPEDASRTEPDFLYEIYDAVIQAGALSIGFTDTVGILTPQKAADTVKRIQDSVKNMDDAMLGVHFHNDLGLATANTLACIKAGANMVQGTINGIGERAGNVAIEEVVLALALHPDEFNRKTYVDPTHLFALSKLVTELTGFHPAANKPVIGRNIFRTEAGIHQDGILKNLDTYMPFRPEVIGAGPVELVLGRNSGSKAVRHYLESTGVEPSEEHVSQILEYIKTGEHDASDMPEIEGFLERLKPFMSVDDYHPQHADGSEQEDPVETH
jgi:2-isopropylmalate synthase